MTNENLPTELRDAALQLRNDQDSRFTGSESPEEVALALLEERATELEESREEAAAKQAELKDKLGPDTSDEDASNEAELDAVSAKQRELREDFGE